MSMYKGPYVFEYIGAIMRWTFLILFFQKHRKDKDLFRKVLAGHNTVADRSWGIFVLNFLIGLIAVILVAVLAVYWKS